MKEGGYWGIFIFLKKNAFFAFIAMDGDSIYIRQVLLSKTWCNKLSRMTICYYCSLKQLSVTDDRLILFENFLKENSRRLKNIGCIF